MMIYLTARWYDLESVLAFFKTLQENTYLKSLGKYLPSFEPSYLYLQNPKTLMWLVFNSNYLHELNYPNICQLVSMQNEKP